MRGPAETRPGQYLVMPYCAAGSLQAHLLGEGGSGLPNFNDRLKIARGLAAGLAHLHAKRIFHRDVKPDNILLTADFVPRLADFGVSKAMGAGGGAEFVTSYKTANQFGTSGYSAREAILGKFGPKTDVYAAGVVLLQLATGKEAVVEYKRTPVPLRDYLLAQHQGPSTEDAAFAQAQADPRCAWPPRAVAGLLQLGFRCTVPDSHERPPAVEIEKVLDDLLKSDGGASGFGARPDLLVSETALTCTICEEALCDCVLLPCNHAVCCTSCAKDLDRCPLCRTAKVEVRPADGPVLQKCQGPTDPSAVATMQTVDQRAAEQQVIQLIREKEASLEQIRSLSSALAKAQSRLVVARQFYPSLERNSPYQDIFLSRKRWSDSTASQESYYDLFDEFCEGIQRARATSLTTRKGIYLKHFIPHLSGLL